MGITIITYKNVVKFVSVVHYVWVQHRLEHVCSGRLTSTVFHNMEGKIEVDNNLIIHNLCIFKLKEILSMYSLECITAHSCKGVAPSN